MYTYEAIDKMKILAVVLFFAAVGVYGIIFLPKAKKKGLEIQKI